jgi:diguanylate cyclase (GGDEF)-like protein/PAS domain S-box-containing protein
MHFLSEADVVGNVIAPVYDWWLVFASVLVAVVASFASFVIQARSNSSSAISENRWGLLAAASFLGLGVWSMHFIGMLAYQLPIAITYDLSITIWSIFPAIGASYIVLNRKLNTTQRLFWPSIVMGVGIGSMHYIGMMAMVMPAQMGYVPSLFILSIVVAIILSGIALKIDSLRVNAETPKVLINVASATCMGLAISGMHYIGMNATLILETPETVYISNDGQSHLADTIFSIALTVSLLVILCLEIRARLKITSRLRNVLNTVHDGVFSISAEGKLLYANTSMQNMFGLTKVEIIGLDFADLLTDDDKPIFNDYLAKTNQKERTDVDEKKLVLEAVVKNGRTFPVMVYINVAGHNGSKSFVGTVTDMTELSEKEAFMQNVFETLPLTLFIKDAKSLNYTHLNKSGEELLKRRVDEVVGRNASQLLNRDEAELLHQDDLDVLASKKSKLIKEEAITIDGKKRYLHTTKVPILDRNGEPKFLLGVSEDVTEFRQAKIELQELSQRLSLATHAAQIGVWDWNLETNELIWDELMYKIFDLPQKSFGGSYQDWAQCLHPDDKDDVTRKVEEAVTNKQDLHCEFRIVTKKSGVKYIRADGQISENRMVGINVDISEIVLAQKKIYRMAQTDHLTGLANRVALNTFVKKEMSRCDRDNKLLGCLYFDLNSFKPINDKYGHIAGDKVLIEMGRRLTSQCRETDLVARIGGDEFVVIISEMDSIDQVQFAQKRYLNEIQGPVNIDVDKVNLSTSVGFSIYPLEAESMDEMLHIADERMYAHKKKKKDASRTKLHKN